MNDYSKILNEVFSGYKKQGNIGNTNFDFKGSLEIEKRKKRNYNSIINNNMNMNNNNQLKTGNLIMNSNYSSIGTLSNANNNSSIFGNSSQKIDSGNNLNNNSNINMINSANKKSRNQNLRYNIYYNKICGLEVFPAKFKEVEKDYNKDVSSINNRIRRAKTKINKNYNPQGYVNMAEILDEINFLINKQKRLNSEGIELAKDWKEIQEENSKFYEKVQSPNMMISVNTLKPYIFEDIFQKKLHGFNNK